MAQARKKGKLSNERIAKLDALGIRWNPQQDKWISYYKLAKKYFQTIGNLEVPDGFVLDGLPLGRWVSVQRQSYNGRQDTLLSSEQIRQLEEIGMVWKGGCYYAVIFPRATDLLLSKKTIP